MTKPDAYSMTIIPFKLLVNFYTKLFSLCYLTDCLISLENKYFYSFKQKIHTTYLIKTLL